MTDMIRVEIMPDVAILCKDQRLADYLQANDEVWEQLVDETLSIKDEEGLETLELEVTYDDDNVEEWYVLDWHE